jgi:hypothetical protein
MAELHHPFMPRSDNDAVCGKGSAGDREVYTHGGRSDEKKAPNGFADGMAESITISIIFPDR